MAKKKLQKPKGKKLATKSKANKKIQRSSSKEIPSKKLKLDWKILLIFPVLILTYIAFLPSLDNQLTNWDDSLYVTENPLIQDESPEAVSNIFTMEKDYAGKLKSNVAGNYHPITVLSLLYNYRQAKEINPETGRAFANPEPFHLWNLIFHLLNTLLVFLFIYLLTNGKWHVAIIVAVLFGIHPMHSESVCWASGRKDVLYSFFFLLSMLAYTQFVRSKNWLFYALAIPFFVLSLLSKPAAVVLPFVLLLIDYFMKRKIDLKMFLDKIPFFIGSIWMGLITVGTQTESEAVAGFETFTIIQRIQFAAYGFVNYIYKLFLPLEISAFYPYPNKTEIASLPYILPIILALALLALTIWSLKKGRTFFFGMVFYLVNVALVLQFVSVGNAIIAERYTYMSYLGLFFLIGMGIDYLWNEKGKISNLKYPAIAVLAVLIGFFTYKTYEASKVWETSETLWTNVIKVFPNRVAKAYNNRGIYLKDAGRLEEALADYNIGIQIDNKNHLTYNSRGNVYKDLAKKDRANFNSHINNAIKDLTQAVALRNDHFQSYNSRGLAYLDLKQFDKALVDFNKALEINPNYIKAKMNRASYYIQTGKYQQALKDYQDYLKAFPGDVAVINAVGFVYYRMKNYPEAIKNFNISVQANPNNKDYVWLRSNAYRDMGGNKAAARRDALKAQSLGQKLPPGYLQSLM